MHEEYKLDAQWKSATERIFYFLNYYIGDPWVVGGSDMQSKALSRYTLTRDSIQNSSVRGKYLKKYS
jgi:hypothetical protein